MRAIKAFFLKKTANAPLIELSIIII